jgi:hypothetical protein
MPYPIRRLATVVAVVAMTLMALPLQAAAGIDPGGYVIRTMDVVLPDDTPGLDGARLPCGTGLRIVTGGAFLHVPGGGPDPMLNAYLSSSAPTRDAKGWFAAGINWGPGEVLLRIVAYCLPKAAIGSYTIVTSEGTPAHGAYADRDRRCPAGQRVVTGGGLWHRSGVRSSTDVEGYLRSSAPDGDARGWYSVGYNDDTDPSFTVIALCRAAGKIGAYSMRRLDVPVGTDEADGDRVDCPAGSRAIPGGAFWHRAGEARDPGLATWLRASAPQAGGKRWYAGGVNNDAATVRLRIVVLCRST